MSLTIYVAGSRDEHEMIADFIAELRAAGWTVTHDWTTGLLPGQAPASARAKSARADLEGVIAAQVLWYVAPTAKSEGSHFELGVAVAYRQLGSGRGILTSGPIHIHARIFPTLGGKHFVKHTQALAWLIRHAQKEREADAIAEWHCRSCGILRGDVHEPWCSNTPGAR